jgi:ketosteroid isomerase-like protein
VADENVERLRRLYEAFNREDFDAVVAMLHPDVEFHPSRGMPPHRGAASVRKWMEPDALVGQRFELLDLAASGDKVLAKHRATARGAASGLVLDATNWIVFEFDEQGLVTRIETYSEREEAREDAGLEG